MPLSPSILEELLAVVETNQTLSKNKVEIQVHLDDGDHGMAKKAIQSPDRTAAVELGHLEADRRRLFEENDLLRRERDQARREAGEERDLARQERDRLLGQVAATQKLLEDQSRDRKAKKRGWWPLFHDE